MYFARILINDPSPILPASDRHLHEGFVFPRRSLRSSEIEIKIFFNDNGISLADQDIPNLLWDAGFHKYFFFRHAVKPWCIDRFLYIHLMIDHIHEDLRQDCYNAGDPGHSDG